MPIFSIVMLVGLFILGGVIPSQAEATGAVPFRMAKADYRWDFPEDHGEHTDYASEWWYMTGHLSSKKEAFHPSTSFGYEATLFRMALPPSAQLLTLQVSRWVPKQFYMVHVALTDIEGQKFYYSSSYERDNPYREVVALNPWTLEAKHLKVQQVENTATGQPIWDLKVDADDYALRLRLSAQKEKVFHGTPKGYSKKGDCATCASLYYSFTNLETTGQVTLKHQALHASSLKSAVTHQVYGKSWFDHEFGSSQLMPKQVGWDWFAVQLDSQQELMLYVMREAGGTLSPQSGGTWVEASGKTQYLHFKDFQIKALSTWKSPQSGAIYPQRWQVKIPKLKLTLVLTPRLVNQELYFPNQKALSYWEGATMVSGQQDKKNVTGKAYVELAGYLGKLHF